MASRDSLLDTEFTYVALLKRLKRLVLIVTKIFAQRLVKALKERKPEYKGGKAEPTGSIIYTTFQGGKYFEEEFAFVALSGSDCIRSRRLRKQ